MKLQEKKCLKCKEIKKMSCFPILSRRKDGRGVRCKDCMHEINKKKTKCKIKVGKHYSRATEFKKGHKKTKIGENNPLWRGGKTKMNGYVKVVCKKHPEADRDGYVLEHRLVMEKMLKRRLKKHEQVHHKNNKRDDNRKENLILFIKGKNWHEEECPSCGFKFMIR